MDVLEEIIRMRQNKTISRENIIKNESRRLSKLVEKKYKCYFCFYSSDNIHIVRQHLITHYVKPQACPYCQETPTKMCHRRSLYAQDKSRFRARQCSVVFSRETDQCDVVFTVNYACELCGKRFRCILESNRRKCRVVLLDKPDNKKDGVPQK